MLPRVADDAEPGGPASTLPVAGGGFAVAYPDQQVAVRGRPTMALLLSDKRIQRNAAFCAAVDADAAATRPSLYLLDRRSSHEGGAAATSCSEALPHYDYYRAGRDLAQYGLDGAAGPVLIAYSGRRSRDLVWDLSGFSDRELARALAVWRQAFPSPPSPAKQGWQTAALHHAIKASFAGKRLAENQLPRALERKPPPAAPAVAEREARPNPRRAKASHGPQRPTAVAAQAGASR